ncbi:MAG: zinc-binding dehydrogenase [Capsulimonadales bacterium]|nr:zinc-binding dehydrogenase [Capsulimonadales bacterium]
MQAKALVAVEPWKTAFQTVDVPDPGPEDVVIRLTYSWISNGTEGSFVRGERIAGDTPRTETDPLPFPHVPGYQKVGIVERIGEGVTDLAVGDVVFATVSHVGGMFYANGGHVSPAVTARSQVYRLPSGADPVLASGLVLTQVGYNIGACPQLSPGDAAVVLGDGLVGHWSAQTLQQRGARVLLVGRHEDRLQRFVCRDGDRAVRANVEELDPLVREWAPQGIQVLADTVGSIASVEALLPQMRHFGQVVSAGFHGPNGRIDIQKLRAKELTLYAPAGWNRSRLETTLAWLTEGRLTTGHLITHRFPATRAAEAFDLILQRRESVLGVILEWEGV